MSSPHAFPKSYSLKSKKHIDILFKKGKSIKVFPLRVVYLLKEHSADRPAMRVLLSVSKKRFALAVDRNRLKRRCREAVRLQRQPLENSLLHSHRQIDIAILYVGSQAMSYADISHATQQALQRIENQLSSQA